MLELLISRSILVRCSLFEKWLHQDSSLAFDIIKKYTYNTYTIPIYNNLQTKKNLECINF